MIILVLMAAAVTAPLPDPIAPANEGKLQCFSPNLAAKTCASLNKFSRSPDGAIDNESTVLIAVTPLVTMTTISPVTITGRRVCAVTTPAVIAAAHFTISGAVPDDAHTAELKAKVTKGYGPILGHTVCTLFEADGSGFTAHISLDGLPSPGVDQRVIWVGDGWTVAR